MKTVVLFSGGLDSVVAAAELATRGRKVVLATVDIGTLRYLCLPMQHYNFLKQRYSEQIEGLVYLDGFYLFKRYVIETIERDIKRYGYNLVCAGCKLVMYSLATVLGLKIDAKTIADGASIRQWKLPEQREDVLVWFKKTFKEYYGVEIEHPVYNVFDKKDIKHLAMKYGVPSSSIEPVCLFSYSFDEDSIPTNTIIEYLEEKFKYIRREIDDLLCRQLKTIVRHWIK